MLFRSIFSNSAFSMGYRDTITASCYRFTSTLSRSRCGNSVTPISGNGKLGFKGIDSQSWNWIGLFLPLLAISPLLAMQGTLLMRKPHLQFFPLAIFAAIYFLNEKINDVDSCGLKTNRDRIYWVHPFWIIAIAIAFVALIFGSPWLAHFCAIVIVGVWAFAARPYFSSVRILGICGLLGVTLPPPFGWDRGLIQGLQALSSIACSRLMDLTGIIHVRRGNIIEVASKQL